jgi:glutaminyl-tRNA synthetase
VLGKSVRLRHAYVIQADKVIKDRSGHIQEVHCSYLPDTLGKNPSDGIKPKGVIHWVAAHKCLDVECRLYDRLFSESHPEEDKEKHFIDFINRDSLHICQAKAEIGLLSAKVGEGYQFEREGYFCLDPDSGNKKLVFNRTIGLKDSFGE